MKNSRVLRVYCINFLAAVLLADSTPTGRQENSQQMRPINLFTVPLERINKQSSSFK
jgi:hypothetical protein